MPKTMLKVFIFLIISVGIFLPKPLSASSNIVINEIMYDLEESDTDREWVEILNLGSDSVDLTNWRLEEGGTNHTLTLKQGDINLGPGNFALIVDNYDKFIQEHAGFSQTVIDSSFSLLNTGEILRIKDSADGNIIDEVNYSSDWRAAGDGNSLQRQSDGSWLSAQPTPGEQNETNPAPSPSPSPTPILAPSPSPTSSSSTKSPTPTSKSSPKSSSKKSPSPSPQILGKSETKSDSPTQQPTIENSIAQVDPNQFNAPSPSPSAYSQPVTKKVAGFLVGAGAILIGLSVGGFLWYKRQEEQPKIQKERDRFDEKEE